MGTHWASLGHTWVLILACHITHPSTHFPPNCKHSLSTHDSVPIEGWGHVWIKRFAHSRSSRSIDMKYKCTFCLDYTVTRLCLPSSGFPPLSTYFTSSSSPVMQQHGPETPAESFFFFFCGRAGDIPPRMEAAGSGCWRWSMDLASCCSVTSLNLSKSLLPHL